MGEEDAADIIFALYHILAPTLVTTQILVIVYYDYNYNGVIQ